jgi:hypothetical protein
MEEIAEEEYADEFDCVMCLQRKQLRDNANILNACFYSMEEKCAECQEKRPQDDKVCKDKTCPLFLITHVYLN